jgi:hypothetical protein
VVEVVVAVLVAVPFEVELLAVVVVLAVATGAAGLDWTYTVPGAYVTGVPYV